MRAPRLQVAPLRRLLEIRNRVPRPPVLSHELGEGHPRLNHTGSERAELLPALNIGLERNRIAALDECALQLAPGLAPPDHIPASALLDAHGPTILSRIASRSAMLP